MNKVALLLFALLSFNPVFCQTVISGYIRGKAIHSLQIDLPPGKAANQKNSSNHIATAIEKNGAFSMILPLDTILFLTLYFDNEPVWIIAGPGDSINIEADFSKDYSTDSTAIHFAGANAAGQAYFNQLNYYPAKKFRFTEPLLDSVTVLEKSRFWKAFVSVIDEMLEPLNVVYAKQEVSTEFCKLMQSSIKGVMIMEFMRNIMASKKSASRFTSEDLINFLDGYVAPAEGINSKYVMRTFMSEYLQYLYAELEMRNLKNMNLWEQTKDTIVAFQGTKHAVSLNLAPLLYAPLNIQEHCWSTLLSGLFAIGGDDLLPGDSSYFFAKFPNSCYRKKLMKQVQVNTCAYNNKVVLLDSLKDQITSLNDMAKILNTDKPMLVDIWASWCIPCKQEFAHNPTLDSVLQQLGITKVYISIDNASFEKAWRNSINQFCLKGAHFLASEALYKNFQESIFHGGEVAVPRYLLLAPSGLVIDNDLPRPSETGALKERLKALIDN